jgi:hypothetical protein
MAGSGSGGGLWAVAAGPEGDGLATDPLSAGTTVDPLPWAEDWLQTGRRFETLRGRVNRHFRFLVPHASLPPGI